MEPLHLRGRGHTEGLYESAGQMEPLNLRISKHAGRAIQAADESAGQISASAQVSHGAEASWKCTECIPE